MKYDAFISYRHLDRDMFVAKKLHRELETTHIPKKIRKETGRKRIRRVFRDQEELPVGSDLGSNIEAALREAEFLIVICSPQTKESYWVMKEIDTFIQMHGRENILAVLVDGEPADSFPPQLLIDEFGNPVEPLAADVRGKRKVNVKKRLKVESLRIAAALLKVDYDDLKQRHRERQMRRRAGFAAIVACLAIAFGAFVTYNLAKINEEYQQKLINESKVLAQTSLEILGQGDRATAAKVALAGLPSKENDRPFVPEAMQALSMTLDCYRMQGEYRHEYLLKHDDNVSEADINSAGTRVLSVDNNNALYLWNTETGKRIFKLNSEYDDDGQIRINNIGFIDDLAIVIAGNKIKAFNLDGSIAYEKEFPEICAISDFARDDKYIYVEQKTYDKETSSFENSAVIVDGKTGEIYKQFSNQLSVDYSSPAVFSEDGRYCAIAHSPSSTYTEEDLDSYVSIINLNDDTIIDIPVEDNEVNALTFTDDGALAVESYNSYKTLNYEAKSVYIEKFDITSGERLWVREIEYSGQKSFAVNPHIISREFEQDGNTYKQITAAIDGTLYVLDEETGADVTSIEMNSEIERVYISSEDDRLYIGCEDGTCYYYNGITGEVYSGVAINFSDSLIDYRLGGKNGGVCISRGFRDSNIVVMRYADKEGALYDKKMDYKYDYGCAVSPSGKYYAVETTIVYNKEEKKSQITVYESKSGKEVGSFTVENAASGGIFFVDNDTVFAFSYDGEFVYYSLSKNKTDSFYPSDERPYASSFYITTNNKYAAYTLSGYKYVVVDIQNRKVISEGSIDSYITSHLTVSEDGKILCYAKTNGSGWIVDTSKGKSKSILDGVAVLQIAIAPDCKTIAAVCEDGKLRLMNIDDKKVFDEIEYYGNNMSYVEFSRNGKQLYMQGGDLYFHIYDIESKEFKYTSDERTMDINYFQYDVENNWAAFFNQNGMFIMDLNSYGKLFWVDYGIAYIPSKNMIVGAYGKSLAAYELKSLDKLIKEAHKKYGNEKLTDIQKLKYRIN